MSGSDVLIACAALAAGAVAAVTGFGIGSLLTPVFALFADAQIAVAAVAIPHVIGTAVRFAMLEHRIDRRVLWGFGVTSALGGLAGALMQPSLGNRWLAVLFGALLLFVAAAEATGLARRLRFAGAAAWAAGALSGLLGGLVGNQGGIRSAALLGFDMRKEAFVATATAIALFVDGARLPVYLVTAGDELAALWRPIALAGIGVVVGTTLGGRLLARLPESWFRPLLAAVLAVLGTVMLVRGGLGGYSRD
jgi:uncharacterized protein